MIGYLDCSTGVSGDKFLGALLDLGEANGAFTTDDLRSIARELAPEAHIDVERTTSGGISAIGVRVTAEGEPPSREWASIRAQLQTATLPARTRDCALSAFEALAIAEAKVHGTAPDAVHFHEVGATDAIVDVVGVCAGLHALGIERLTASVVAVGSGTVETSHGILPVPAPATAVLLDGVPVVAGAAAGELTTPTGAALLRACCSGFGTLPSMRMGRAGYGAGTRDLGTPNVCRLIVGESVPGLDAAGLTLEQVVLLETNIDHLSPEELAFDAEELLADGALDVWHTPIVMKKGRAAVTLSVLAASEEAERLAQRAISLTGSLGVRHTPVERWAATREVREVETVWGPVRVKVGAGRVRPEHDDVARIAREHGLAYADVVSEVVRLAGAAEGG